MTVVNSGVLFRLAEMLVQSSLLITVVLALRAVFGQRLDRRLRYYLWLPVMPRLLLPVSIGSRLSVMNLFKSVSRTGTERPFMPTGTAMLTDPSNAVCQTAALSTSAQTFAASLTLENVLLCVWLMGITIVALIAVSVNIRFYGSLKKDRKEADIEILPDLCERLGLKRVPAVYISDATESPCAVGLFRPVIYLPSWAVSDQERLRYILLHELTHIKYRDNMLSLLTLACCAVYWFDPLVWIMMYSARRDRELACDAWVTGGMGTIEKTAYGMALVSAVETQLGFERLVCAPAFASRRKEMVDRIVSIKNGKLVTKRAAVIVCAVMLLALVTAGTSAKAASPGSAENNAAVSDDGSLAPVDTALLYSTPVSDVTNLYAVLDNLDRDTAERLSESLAPGECMEYAGAVIENTGVGRRISIVDPGTLRLYKDGLYSRVKQSTQQPDKALDTRISGQ